MEEFAEGRKNDDCSLVERSPPVKDCKIYFTMLRPKLCAGRHPNFDIWVAPWQAKEKNIFNARAREGDEKQ